MNLDFQKSDGLVTAVVQDHATGRVLEAAVWALALLEQDTTADVAVVGAGIAGVATAFFILRDTRNDVLLLERDRVARGATGRNAGQLTTYFERPLGAIELQ